MRNHLVGLALGFALAATADAQSVLGTYSMTPPGQSPITLVLQKNAQGKIVGSLTVNGASYAIAADMQGDDVSGLMSGAGLRSYFEARREGAGLHMIIADYGADGKPDYVHARELVMTATNAAPATQSGSTPAPSSGNPLAAGSAPTSDKFAGTFASTDVALSLSKAGAGYTGTVRYRGAEYPATLRPTGETLTGSFNAGGQPYEMSISSAGDGKYVNLTTGGTTYLLARGGPSANPLSAAPSGATSSLAKTPQDQQIAKLLMSTAWCSFSFSGSSTSASSGTSRSSRAVFRADGTASEGSNSESTYSGSAGTVFGQSGNGKQGKWRIENGLLMLSADGLQWTPQSLKIADNGSGSPIVTAGGKEYMVCR